jgi:hypothetical protein
MGARRRLKKGSGRIYVGGMEDGGRGEGRRSERMCFTIQSMNE